MGSKGSKPGNTSSQSGLRFPDARSEVLEERRPVVVLADHLVVSLESSISPEAQQREVGLVGQRGGGSIDRSAGGDEQRSGVRARGGRPERRDVIDGQSLMDRDDDVIAEEVVLGGDVDRDLVRSSGDRRVGMDIELLSFEGLDERASGCELALDPLLAGVADVVATAHSFDRLGRFDDIETGPTAKPVGGRFEALGTLLTDVLAIAFRVDVERRERRPTARTDVFCVLAVGLERGSGLDTTTRGVFEQIRLDRRRRPTGTTGRRIPHSLRPAVRTPVGFLPELPVENGAFGQRLEHLDRRTVVAHRAGARSSGS